MLVIDPEDLQAHYNLMLCYNGLGNEKLAKEHQARYMRFKADESSQAITGPYRQLHPEDNNERQAVHEHVSVPLTAVWACAETENRRASREFSRPYRPVPPDKCPFQTRNSPRNRRVTEKQTHFLFPIFSGSLCLCG